MALEVKNIAVGSVAGAAPARFDAAAAAERSVPDLIAWLGRNLNDALTDLMQSAESEEFDLAAIIKFMRIKDNADDINKIRQANSMPGQTLLTKFDQITAALANIYANAEKAINNIADQSKTGVPIFNLGLPPIQLSANFQLAVAAVLDEAAVAVKATVKPGLFQRMFGAKKSKEQPAETKRDVQPATQAKSATEAKFEPSVRSDLSLDDQLTQLKEHFDTIIKSVKSVILPSASNLSSSQMLAIQSKKTDQRLIGVHFGLDGLKKFSDLKNIFQVKINALIGAIPAGKDTKPDFEKRATNLKEKIVKLADRLEAILLAAKANIAKIGPIKVDASKEIIAENFKQAAERIIQTAVIATLQVIADYEDLRPLEEQLAVALPETLAAESKQMASVGSVVSFAPRGLAKTLPTLDEQLVLLQQEFESLITAVECSLPAEIKRPSSVQQAQKTEMIGEHFTLNELEKILALRDSLQTRIATLISSPPSADFADRAKRLWSKIDNFSNRIKAILMQARGNIGKIHYRNGEPLTETEVQENARRVAIATQGAAVRTLIEIEQSQNPPSPEWQKTVAWEQEQLSAGYKLTFTAPDWKAVAFPKDEDPADRRQWFQKAVAAEPVAATPIKRTLVQASQPLAPIGPGMQHTVYTDLSRASPGRVSAGGVVPVAAAAAVKSN